MYRNLPDTPLVAAIQHELENGCHGFPAKRAALRLALIMMKSRHAHWELWRALECVGEIKERIEKVKVV